MATFRCKRSGNCVTFTLQEDIDGLRKHEGYVEVLEVVEKPKDDGKELMEAILQKSTANAACVAAIATAPMPEKKRMGRPRKVG